MNIYKLYIYFGIMNLSQEVAVSQETNPRLKSDLFGNLVSVSGFVCLTVYVYLSEIMW